MFEEPGRGGGIRKKGMNKTGRQVSARIFLTALLSSLQSCLYRSEGEKGLKS